MIAITSGEEGFTDSNNNGVYDQGEPFDDLTEPFVDANDNGTWDPDERFIDINGNKTWDGKNDRWDANTLIWVEEKILWTGIPDEKDAMSVVPGVTGHRPVFLPVSPSVLNLTCPGTGSLCAQAGPPVDVTAYIADPWFNSLAQNGDGDKCLILESDESPVKVTTGNAAGTVYTYPYTYPAGRYLKFRIADARDPNVPADENVPRRSPPIDFVATIFCQYTASPLDSYSILVAAGTVTGKIE
jgi:hypothetical protein